MLERLKELGFVAWIGILVLVLMGLLSVWGLAYKATFGKASVDIDRQIFESSESHVKGVADDLAKYKRELTTEKDPIARKAIVELINDRFADFDANDLNNPNLRAFLLDVRNGKYDK